MEAKTHAEAVRQVAFGFKCIQLPEVTTFGELFTDSRSWDLGYNDEAAKHHDLARVLPGRHSARRYTRSNDRPFNPAGTEDVGPWCAVQLQASRFYLAVRPSDVTLAAVAPRAFSESGPHSFQIIEHHHGWALVICEPATYIGSTWLAYIDPATIAALEMGA